MRYGLAVALAIFAADASAATRTGGYGLTATEIDTLGAHELLQRARFHEQRELIETAAYSEHPVALLMVAAAQLTGFGMPRNYQLAREHARRAAAAGVTRGHAIACAAGLELEHPKVQPATVAECLSPQTRSTPHGRTTLAWAQIYGRGVPQDIAAGHRALRAEAETGYAGAQAQLGVLLLTGELIPKDVEQGVLLLASAAEQSSAPAAVFLAQAYLDGRAGRRDPAAAVSLVTAAAEMGDPSAQTLLGFWHSEGKLVPLDQEAEARWYRLAAEQGHAAAEYNLGTVYYRRGGKIPRDPQQALFWFSRAAAKGDADAQVMAGFMHMEGELGPEDGPKALEYYRRAAAQGNANGMNGIGKLYEFGTTGVPRNEQLAYSWYEKAAAAGHQGARERVAKRERERLAGAKAVPVSRPPSAPPRVSQALKTPLRTPAPAAQPVKTAAGGPSADIILGLSDTIRARVFGWRKTGTPGRLVMTSALGDIGYVQRSVSDVSCRKLAPNNFRCSYTFYSTLQGGSSGLMGQLGMIAASARQAFGLPNSSRLTFDFKLEPRGWSSVQLAEAIEEEKAEQDCNCNH